jgi:hypothetical protein
LGGPLTLTDPALYDGSAGKKIKRLPNAPEPSPKRKAKAPAE